jgi:hypothetical protein
MPELSDMLIARLQVMNPGATPESTRAAFAGLYDSPPNWTPFAHHFEIPRVVLRDLVALAADGVDICPHLARWLDQIGVTDALVSRMPLIEHLPPPYIPPQRRFEVPRSAIDALRAPKPTDETN